MAKDITPDENREIEEWTRKKQYLLNKPVLTAAFGLFRAGAACEFPALLAQLFAACLAAEEAKDGISIEAEEMRAAAREANRAKKDAAATAAAQSVLARPSAPQAGDEVTRLKEAIQEATREYSNLQNEISALAEDLAQTDRAAESEIVARIRVRATRRIAIEKEMKDLQRALSTYPAQDAKKAAKSAARASIAALPEAPRLVPIHETPLQKKVYSQLRSNGGVIRIEHGDGK